MKKPLVSILLCFTLFQGFSHAQEVFGGLRLANNFLSTNGLPRQQPTLNLEPGISLGLKIGSNFSFEGRWEVLISEDYGGMQYGFYARENVLKDILFVMGGINILHSYDDGPLGNSGQWSFGGSHTMLGGGLGYNISENSLLELSYFRPLDQSFGFSTHWNGMQASTEEWKLHNIVKLSFGYNFSLFSKTQEEKTTLGEYKTEEIPPAAARKRRHLFLSGGTGFPNLIDAQLGYQIMDNLSLAGILNWGVYSDPEFKEFSAGLRLSGYFSGFIFNNVSLEYGKQLENFFNGSSEGPLVLTVGNDNTSDRLFNFFWAAGVMGWFDRHGKADEILPVIKIGTNLNF